MPITTEETAGQPYLAVEYTPAYAEVAICGDVAGLLQLRAHIDALLKNPRPGRHVHLDDFTGLRGTVPHLVISVTTPEDQPILATSDAIINPSNLPWRCTRAC